MTCQQVIGDMCYIPPSPPSFIDADLISTDLYNMNKFELCLNQLFGLQ